MKKIIKIFERIMILLVIIIAIHLFIAFIYKLEHEQVNLNYIWNIKFTNYSLTENSQIPEMNFNDNKLDFQAILEEGEFVEFTIDIKNEGVLNAKLSKINFNVIDEKNVFIYSINYIDGTSINVKDILPSNNEKSIVIRVEFPKTEPKLYDAAMFKLELNLEYSAI